MMKITELVKICSSTLPKVLSNIDFVLSYILFKLLLDGSTEISKIGIIKLKTKKDKKVLEIVLADEWQYILAGKDMTNMLTKRLINYFEDKK